MRNVEVDLPSLVLVRAYLTQRANEFRQLPSNFDALLRNLSTARSFSHEAHNTADDNEAGHDNDGCPVSPATRQQPLNCYEERSEGHHRCTPDESPYVTKDPHRSL